LETTNVIWQKILTDPVFLVFSVGALAIVIPGVAGITKMIITHRERMALIAQGLHPDEKPEPELSVATPPPLEETSSQLV
jgi:hypothetical protein